MLVTWCQIAEEDFGLQIPATLQHPIAIRWMAHQVAIRAGRILASDAAEALLQDLLGYEGNDGWHPGLRSLEHLIDARQRARGVRVECPACGTWVRLRDDEAVIYCPGWDAAGTPCAEWGTIEHWRRLVPDADRPMTAAELVEWLAKHHRFKATEQMIRHWASRGTRQGKLTVCGIDGTGRTTYDPVRAAEIVMVIRGRVTTG